MTLNKNNIIESIYKDKAYKNVCRNISTPELFEDLFHEVVLILLEKTEQELINAHEGRFLKFLFIRIAHNQYKSATSDFHKKYRGQLSLVCIDNVSESSVKENQTYINEKDFTATCKEVTDFINTFSDYDKNLFNVWINLGMSSAEVSRQTGIEQQNISKKILQLRKRISEKYGKDYLNIFNE